MDGIELIWNIYPHLLKKSVDGKVKIAETVGFEPTFTKRQIIVKKGDSEV